MTFGELEKGRSFPIGEAHVITATFGKGNLVEMEDVNFHTDSAVLLADPECGDAADVPEQDRITGLSVLATALRYAQDHKSELLVIAGHTDTEGDANYNIGLSKKRADNVFFALVGDREGWAKSSLDQHQVEDAQAILKWIAKRFGWDTDPGEIDNDNGEKTKRAIGAFKVRYNAEFRRNIPEDRNSVGLEGWRAFFDVYMLTLAELLETNEDGLIAMRGNLTFLEGAKKTVGCGENHPIDSAEKDSFRSKVNRRVELLFFDPEERLPKLDCHAAAGKCDKSKCQIYGKGLFDLRHIPCGGDTPGFSGNFQAGAEVKPSEDEPAAGAATEQPPSGVRMESRGSFNLPPQG